MLVARQMHRLEPCAGVMGSTSHELLWLSHLQLHVSMRNPPSHMSASVGSPTAVPCARSVRQRPGAVAFRLSRAGVLA